MNTLLIIGAIVTAGIIFWCWDWVKKNKGKTGAIVVATSVLLAQASQPIDTSFQDLPNVAKEQGIYRVTFDRWSDVEIKDQNIPEVKLRKWGDETYIKISYPDFSPVNPKQDKGKLKWVNGDKEVHLYQVGEENFEFEIILKEKPITNKIVFNIETQGLDFFYQPPLDEEMNDLSCTPTDCQGSHRPENVVGSYAVYNKQNKQWHSNQESANKYKVGKAFHIYRPKSMDADYGSVFPSKYNYTRFIDASSLDLYFSSALQEVLFTLRIEDKIPDTVWLHTSLDPMVLGVRTQDNNNLDKIRARCKELGINYSRIIMPYGGGVHANGFSAISFIKKENTNCGEILKTWRNVLLDTFLSLNIDNVTTTIAGGGRAYQFKVDGKKIGGCLCAENGNNYMLGSGIWTAYDYDAVANITGKDERAHSINITELNENISIDDVKLAFTASYEKIFSTSISEEETSVEEISLMNLLLPKYRSDEWNDLGNNMGSNPFSEEIRLIDKTFTWGDLYIDEQKNTLTVTIPQDFLDNAVYPIRHAAGLTFGNTGVGGSTTDFSNSMVGALATGAAGTGTSISAYLSTDDGMSYKFALYKHSDLYLETNGTTDEGGGDGSTGWKTLNFTSAPTITAIEYVITGWGDNTYPGNATIKVDNTTGANQWHNKIITYGSWPDPTTFSHLTGIVSIYCTYTAGNGAARRIFKTD